MKPYPDSVTEDLRLAILQILRRLHGETNSRILRTELPTLGHNISADRMRTELAWLAEQSAVTLAEVGAMHVVMVTERGADLAAGRASIPGIRRPEPHERG